MAFIPRDYQDYAVGKVFEYFAENEFPGNPLVAMPTGTGKSPVIALIILQALQMYSGTRIMMLTETKELVEQNYRKLKEIWPMAPVGIYCDGLGRKDFHYPVTFGTIGSVKSVPAAFGYIDFVIVDECHGISTDDDTMYRQFLSALRQVNPKVKVIGTTATHWRMKQGLLTEGENALFTDIIVDMTDLESYNWFFEQGYLVPPTPRPTSVEYDLLNVKIKGGEYDQKSAQAAVDNQKKNEAVVLELLEFGQHRHCGMVFAGGVEHCQHLYDIFKYYGESVTWVASRGMSGKQRDYNIAMFKAGDAKWMINNGILTTGFDHPPVDIMGIARLILSPGLWVQILGRGTRPLFAHGFDLTMAAGRLAAIAASLKQNCLVLDFANNTTRLGTINAPRIPLPPERKRKGDAPIRICDGCGCYNHASARICWQCGHEFPRYLKIDETASKKALVTTVNSGVAPVPIAEYKEVAVDHVTYSLHKKPGKPDSMKVEYHCGRKVFREWVLFDHQQWSGKARAWWRKFSGTSFAPASTEMALSMTDVLRQPRAIEVAANLEFPDIKNHIFE